MLVTLADEMAGIMTLLSLTDAAALAMEQWRLQHPAFIDETFLKMATLLSKRSEYIVSISILLLATENFLAEILYSFFYYFIFFTIYVVSEY
jgi:hypothetical protein